jgi:hypothetical protein
MSPDSKSSKAEILMGEKLFIEMNFALGIENLGNRYTSIVHGVAKGPFGADGHNLTVYWCCHLAVGPATLASQSIT